MADRPQPHQIQVHPQRHFQEGGVRSLQQRGPSTSKLLAVITVLPLGGTLLGISGLTLAGTLFTLAVTAPLYLVFSPVLFPAALTIALAVAALLTSGVLGLTGLSSLSWVYNLVRTETGSVPEQIDYAKRRMQDMAAYVGQKTKDVGQEIQSKAQDQGVARERDRERDRDRTRT